MFLWIRPTLLTLELMAFTVVVASIIGTMNAWAASVLSNGTPKQRKINQFFLTMHLLIGVFPLILHAVAWESTAGKFGLTMLTQTGVRGVSGAPYGFFGGLIASGWIHGITGSSLVCLATYIGTQRVPSSLLESGRLQFSENQLWWRVRFPLARPWWMMSLLATAMLTATEMTVADLYGFRTLADEFYLLYAANPSITSVIQTCILPLVVLVGGSLWWINSKSHQPTANSFSATDDQPIIESTCLYSPPSFSTNNTRVALLTISLLTSIALLVPLMSMLVKLGQHIVIIDDQLSSHWSPWLLLERLAEAPIIFADEYFWTAILSSFTACTALLVAWPLAAMGRSSKGILRSVDFITLGMAIIPGPIIAMMVIRFFQLPVAGFSEIYERSILPTSIALLARAIPIAYWVLRTGYVGIPQRQIDSLSLEMSWFRRLILVDRHLIGRSLVQAFLISSIFASGDVPASLPVLPPGMTTVGSRLFGLLHSGARFQEAALAFWYLMACASAAMAFIIISRQVSKSPPQ